MNPFSSRPLKIPFNCSLTPAPHSRWLWSNGICKCVCAPACSIHFDFHTFWLANNNTSIWGFYVYYFWLYIGIFFFGCSSYRTLFVWCLERAAFKGGKFYRAAYFRNMSIYNRFHFYEHRHTNRWKWSSNECSAWNSHTLWLSLSPPIWMFLWLCAA